MIFNYSDLKDVVSRDGAMLPGQKSRVTNVDTIVAKPSNPTKEIFDGMLVKLVDGKVEPITSASDVVFGIVVEDLRAQRKGGTFDFGGTQMITSYYPGAIVSVMQKGFIYVPVVGGATITSGTAVKYTNEGKVSLSGANTLENAYYTGNSGFPLSAQTVGDGEEETSRTAEIVIDFSLKA